MGMLVFRAGIRVNGQIFNASIKIVEQRGWPKLVPLAYLEGDLQVAVDEACRDVNAFLANGFPLDVLATAARTSSSNQAEIIKCAAEAVREQTRALESFAR